MSSLRNMLPRKVHKERSQPQARKKFGLLEKHKDYVVRAEARHKKEQTLQKLKEKAVFRNPDEFYFRMAKTRTIDEVHRPESEANKYTAEELMLMKSQDIGYILQKIQSEKNQIERHTPTLHFLDNKPLNRHVYYAEDRKEGKDLQLKKSVQRQLSIDENFPKHVKWKTAASYRELEARKSRIHELEKLYMDMALKKELQKKGRKRKLREDQIICPTSKPMYKWQTERKR